MGRVIVSEDLDGLLDSIGFIDILDYDDVRKNKAKSS
jgi:hypothetical protein